MDYEDFKEWFLSQYEADEIVNILQIEATILVDRCEDELLQYYKDEIEGRV